MSRTIRLILIGSLVGLFGCHSRQPLLPPSDVKTITGDGEIILYWTIPNNPSIEKFRIYRSTRPAGYFTLIAEVSGDSYIDQDVENGITYYYAVSSVDEWGNESELTDYPIFDTPRPERHNQRIFAYSQTGDSLGFSGYLLSIFSPTWKDSGDFYFTYENGVPKFRCQPNTYIQDLGITEDLTDINWAPEEGWTDREVQVALNHSYVIWTRDNHFAHVRVKELTSDYVVFDVAYQLQAGNHELSTGAGGGSPFISSSIKTTRRW